MTAVMALLLPREHGAWVQLGFALLAPLLLGRPQAASFALVTAAALAFLAHESLAILLGHRGERIRQRDGRGAWTQGALLGTGALGAFVVAHLLLPEGARVAMHPPLVLGAVFLLFTAARKERTAAGELVAAAAMAAWAVPIGMAGGLSALVALQAWLALGASFSLGTLAVRAVIFSAKPKATFWLRGLTAGASATTLALFAALGITDVIHPAVAAAVVPCALFALAVAAMPPHPRALERTGWGLTAACLLATVSLVVGI